MNVLRANSVIVLLILCVLGITTAKANDWSAATHNIYPGDFDGEGNADVLLQAKKLEFKNV